MDDPTKEYVLRFWTVAGGGGGHHIYVKDITGTLSETSFAPVAAPVPFTYIEHPIIKHIKNSVQSVITTLNKVNQKVKNSFNKSKFNNTNEKRVVIKNIKSGLFLDVKWSQTHEGNTLHLWPYNGTDAQIFIWQDDGTIKSSLSDLVLDVRGGVNEGADLIMWSKHGGANQTWI